MLAILSLMLLLGLVLAGIMVMFKPEAGKRLVVGVLVLLFLGPLILCLLNSAVGSLSQTAGEVRAPSGGGSLLFVLFLVLALVAVVRFVVHRRRLRQILGERPTSLKRRLDAEGQG